MAIVQISRIQHRRGLHQDLPQLASAELGWSIDQRRLFIGNGLVTEGAPTEGMTEILTEYSDILNLSKTYTFKGLISGIEIQTGPDAQHPVVRTLQDKLDDIVSVRDFGAVGDGTTDDTEAIQRALTRPLGDQHGNLAAYRHRAVYFPAGNYKVTSTINIPPYTRLYGEGKTVSTIFGTFGGPIAQLADSFGQVGGDFGANATGAAENFVSEHHFNDLQFWQQSGDYSQPVFLIDGAWTATFNRCSFRGMLSSYNSADANSHVVDRGYGVSGVAINNASYYVAVTDVKFFQCDFISVNYGIEYNYAIRGSTITDCYFDRCYQHIVIGKDTPNFDYYPRGITVTGCHFRYSAKESLYCGQYSGEVMSLYNWYGGSSYSESDVPTAPCITFTSDQSYSIGDTYDRTDQELIDYPFPNVETNGYSCYIIGHNTGFVNGLYNSRKGRAKTLEDQGSLTDTGILPDSYQGPGAEPGSNIVINYTLVGNNNVRTGALRINNNGGTIVWDDEYSESGDTTVVLSVNTSTGAIEYTSDSFNSAGATANILYTINYFIV